MSTPSRRVRQPGRTFLGTYPHQCEICDNSLGGIGSIDLAIRNFVTCSFFNGDGGSYLNIPLNAGQCGELSPGGPSISCNWGISFVTGGHTIQITVTAKCVAGVPTFEISINDVTDGLVIVQGSWDASPAVCGELDCTGLGSSGWLPFTTINSSGLCGNPAQVGSPEYMVTFHAGEACPQEAHRNCCCGGPVVKCFCVNLFDPNCGNNGSALVCWDAAQQKFVGVRGSVDVEVSYSTDPVPAFTVTFNCGTVRSYTFVSGDPGWTRLAGALNLSYSDPSGWSASATLASDACSHCGGCCTTYSERMIVEIHAGEPDYDGTYLLENNGVTGASCDWSFTRSDGTQILLGVQTGCTFNVDIKQLGVIVRTWQSTGDIPFNCGASTSTFGKTLTSSTGSPGFAVFYAA